MPDLDVVGLIVAKPGEEATVRDALQALVAPTRDEEGCLAYDLYVSGADATQFVTVERWRSQQDLDAHLHTPHVQQAFQAAGAVLAVPPAVHPLVPVA